MFDAVLFFHIFRIMHICYLAPNLFHYHLKGTFIYISLFAFYFIIIENKSKPYATYWREFPSFLWFHFFYWRGFLKIQKNIVKNSQNHKKKKQVTKKRWLSGILLMLMPTKSPPTSWEIIILVNTTSFQSPELV